VPLPGPASKARQSFSQQGEDIVLYHLLHDWMKITAPTYLDIGAADPVESNNTYLMYWTGGRGVLVEPNPDYVRRLRLERPGDIVVHAGIGVSDATDADYYVIRGAPTLNTFSKDQVEMYRRTGSRYVVDKVMKMPLISINHVIRDCIGRAPDLISIDVEGLDLAILRTLDFATYRPAAFIAETVMMGGPRGTDNGGIGDLLLSKGYVARGGSLYNTIFADPARYA
jgi:FkbM family methyltransferase